MFIGFLFLETVRRWHLSTLNDIYQSFLPAFKLVQVFFGYAEISLRFNLAVEYCVICRQSHLGLDVL